MSAGSLSAGVSTGISDAMQYRSNRLAHQLRDEISSIISREIKDPRVGFATITEVRVSPDLKYAKIFFSVLGPQEKKKDTLEALNHASGFVRRQLGSRLRLRQVPEIQFTFDETIEYGAKMDAILDEVGHELRAAEENSESLKEGSTI